MPGPASGAFVYRAKEFVATMAIGFLIPSTNGSPAQPGSNAMNGTGGTQQGSQCEAFSALLKDAIKNTGDEQAPTLSDAGNPGESTPVTAVRDQATGSALTGIVVGALSQVPDNQELISTVADRTESLPITDAKASGDPNLSPSPSSNPNPIGPTVQNIASIPLLQLNPTVTDSPDDGTQCPEPVADNPSQPEPTDRSNASLPQPAFNPDSSNEVPAIQSASPTTDKLASQNGRGAPAHSAPVPLEQPSDVSAPSGLRPPSSSIPDQKPTPIMGNQGSTNLLPTAQGQGNAPVQPLVQPSAGIRSSAIIQEQGDHETTLLSQALSVRMIEEGGGGAQTSFEDPAQGEAEGGPVQFNASGTSESSMRATQSMLFSDEFSSAQHTRFLSQGAGTSGLTQAADQLKLTRAFFGEDHSATMTAPRGMAQTVHVELPSHEAGPLSVRISVTDQMVHTQFTTDRSDLGAILVGRQDQLQQNLTRSGLELGQFQVHINQEGRQDALPDRQSRRNGEAPDRQLASQDQGPQSHDRERPNHRAQRALSLFA